MTVLPTQDSIEDWIWGVCQYCSLQTAQWRAHHLCHLHFLLRHAGCGVHAGHHAAGVLWKRHCGEGMRRLKRDMAGEEDEERVEDGMRRDVAARRQLLRRTTEVVGTCCWPPVSLALSSRVDVASSAALS